jgi:NAD(P)-dependent dehydrogenase (short-subunit alcohol dehydrogenase family)
VSSEREVRAMVATAVATYGRLDCAFNNAGVTAYGYTAAQPILFADVPLGEFRRVLDVNLVGVFLCIKYEIPAMLKSGGGSIVNTSSCSGVITSVGAPDYTASKHGVIGLTKSAAIDYATRNIRVNAVLPGVIRTPMTDSVFGDNPEMAKWAAASMPIKRAGEPHEVAEAALWLLSDAASLVTGHSMLTDGGFTAV